MIQQCHEKPNFDLGYQLLVKQLEGNTLSETEQQYVEQITSVVDSQITELLQSM